MCCFFCFVLSHLWTMPSQVLKTSAGYNHAISDFLMTLNGMCLSAPTWLLQCLRYQHGSCFIHPCCCSVLLSCCATRLYRSGLCATQYMTQRDTLLLLYPSETNGSNKSLHQDAVSLGSDMFTTLIPVQRRWSFVMIHIHDGHFFFCLPGANFYPTAPPAESRGIIFWKFLCACAY